MKLLIPKVLTCLFLLFVVGIGLTKAFAFFWPQASGEKVAIQYQTCGADDLQQKLRAGQPNKFILVVVGDGVKDNTLAKTRPYSSNYAQGWDLYEGIALAAKKAPFTDISNLVDLVYVDDGGDSRCARLISEEIIKSPKVIGVIGHASSGTTRVALENYKKANIPTIIPIATAPYLTVDCRNCFRLPSNDVIQAKAIADYAVNVLKGQNIYLVWDGSESAKDYSEFLESEVVNLIGSKIKFRQPVTYRPMNYEYLLKSISYNETDVLIFCGYGSMAREFLNGLRFEYIGKENTLTKPKVILSDGARISDIKEVSTVFGFEAYLSFPSDQLKTKSQFSGFVPETPPREEEKMKDAESYEIFGYDALTLFSLAFKQMKQRGNISRQLLNEFLAANAPQTEDLCYTYKFDKGENVEAQYFIYSVGSDSIERRYDSTYLTDVFTDRPVESLVGRSDNIATVDNQLIDTLIEQLTHNPNSKAVIIISDTQQTEKATQHAKRLLDYLVSTSKIEVARILFFVGVAPKGQTQIWLFPPGVRVHTPPENHTLVKAETLLTNRSQSVSNKK
jgi:ABC-type branched-subunit amino acid transport system substrate-binding protein